MTKRIIFVTGTDTDVGKTFIASLLTKCWNCNYWKPIQTGTESDVGDTYTVKSTTGLDSDHFSPPGFAFMKPLSPWRAALIEGKNVEVSDIRIPQNFLESERSLIIEGAGGPYVPINDTDIMTDLALALSCGVILVSRSGLGTLNHTLLCLEHFKHRGVRVLGVILNGDVNQDNATVIETLGQVPILCQVPVANSIDDVMHLVPKFDSIFAMTTSHQN
ncbi:dethiobiotin synthetase [Scheffersomyces xylosifermentans]|uniref:dethiobiotin synthetase n=1 Tax=Scheffersomyces xylosifermentans TaxID=1304137 RepID=UPI00315CE026